MAFTFAHPAAVIPLKRVAPKWLCLTALVIGSMAPDFEYFIRFKVVQTIGHTLPGIFFMDLPLVVIVAYLFHYVIKTPIIRYLPEPLSISVGRLLSTEWRLNSLRKIAVFLYSAIIGVASHFLWDAFTHKEGYFVTKFSLLAVKLRIFEMRIPIYKLLQHGSTLVGFAILAVFWFHIVRQYEEKIDDTELARVNSTEKLRYWFLLTFVSAVVFGCRVIFALGSFQVSNYGHYIVSAISSLILGTIVVSGIYKYSSFADTIKQVRSAKTVILVHGYNKTEADMFALKENLEKFGYRVFTVNLPTRFQTLETCVIEFEKQFDEIGKNAQKVHLVGHSMGGLIIRSFLAKRNIPNLGRVVLIAPPNKGTRIADISKRYLKPIFNIFKSMQCLVTASESIPEPLNRPKPEIGVIAGSKNNLLLGFFLSNNESDGRVEVESTKLDGMTDFITVPYGHKEIHHKQDVAALVDKFLPKGKF